MTEDEIRELFARADTDGDGKIDRAELEAWERSEREREKERREQLLIEREKDLVAWEKQQVARDMEARGVAVSNGHTTDRNGVDEGEQADDNSTEAV